LKQPHTKEYEESFKKKDDEGRRFMVAHGIKRYWDETEKKGKPFGDVWGDIKSFQQQPTSDQKVDYATQKPDSLLERIIQASSNKGMIVADFFGGSGVTAKVASKLERNFIHVDVGVNSIQTTRDVLIKAGASFQILEVQDGVSLFRNPQQTMDKLATLITGLQQNVAGLSKFWFGTIDDSKQGTMPVYMPDLINGSEKLLDQPAINRIINDELHKLDFTPKKAIVYYVDVDDRPALEKFIKEHNATQTQIELRDLKALLHDIVLEDEFSFVTQKNDEGYEVEITQFTSDRLQQKIADFNEKGHVQALKKGKEFAGMAISDEGLELIEFLSLDCTNSEGAWQSDSEIKIDKLGYVSLNGEKKKAFWNGKINATQKPKRLKIRNISGDETIKIIS